MNKLFLIQNPEVFQGEKYIKTSKNGIAFIPGISINQKEKNVFIQGITNDFSYFVDYNINDFKFNLKPFYVKIGNNFFSKEKLHIDINDNSQNLIVCGDIKYSDSKKISTNILNPNIMGPFAYVPFMECNHAILNMKNKANGQININNNKIMFDNGLVNSHWYS